MAELKLKTFIFQRETSDSGDLPYIPILVIAAKKKKARSRFLFLFFCLLHFGKLWERETVHQKQTRLLAQAVRSNKDSPWCTCSDSSWRGKGGSCCAWYAQIPSEPRLFHINTPGDPFRLTLNSLKHLTQSWLMGQHCTGQPITLHFIRWMHRPHGITVGHPTLVYNQCCMQFDLRMKINSLPASFITAGTVPINFKSLSGTWSICPTRIYGARTQAI